MNIKIGDKVRMVDGLTWAVVEMPGGSEDFPDDYKVRRVDNGDLGLMSPSSITHVNGKPVSEKPEKKVYAMAPEGCRDWITPGKVYECLKPKRTANFTVVDNQGDIIGCNWKRDGHLNGGDWTRLELTEDEAALINAKVDAANDNDVTTKPIDLERLKTDRYYWDEVAPEGAEYYGQKEPGWLECWYRMSGSDWEYLLADGRNSEWKKASVTRGKENLISRPAPAWNGEGLPPVGVECEAWYAKGDWVVGKVIAHDEIDGTPVAVFKDGERYTAFTACCLRPLKTEKERVVDAVMEVAGFGENMRHGLNKAFEANALRMPKGEK